jgi:hypothetical protein
MTINMSKTEFSFESYGLPKFSGCHWPMATIFTMWLHFPCTIQHGTIVALIVILWKWCSHGRRVYKGNPMSICRGLFHFPNLGASCFPFYLTMKSMLEPIPLDFGLSKLFCTTLNLPEASLYSRIYGGVLSTFGSND